MRAFATLLRHELRTLLYSPFTYTAGVLFLLLMGYLYFRIIEDFTRQVQTLLPSEMFFSIFWLPALFTVPLLTMRSMAEERRLGTLETLLSTPITATSVVLAKFFAAYVFYLVLWAGTALFPLITGLVVDDSSVRTYLLAPGPLLGGGLFIALSGLLFIAVGVFASSLTRSQLVAGMLCFSILFILIVGLPGLRDQADTLELWVAEPLGYLQVFSHVEDFTRGVFDTRPVFFYLTLTFLMLGLSTLVVEAKA